MKNRTKYVVVHESTTTNGYGSGKKVFGRLYSNRAKAELQAAKFTNHYFPASVMTLKQAEKIGAVKSKSALA